MRAANNRRMRYQILISGVLFFTILFSSKYLYSENFADGLELTFSASFEENAFSRIPRKIKIDQKGGTIIADGLSGSALRLNKGDYFSFKTDTVVGSEGTIMMWVRPHWGYYAAEKEIIPISHTFASFRWSDNGYFVLSDGWWELAGSPYTYLVGNNNVKLHTHQQIKYVENEWVHIACSYKIGTVAFVKIFINGEKVSEKRTFLSRTAVPVGNIFIGSDMGTSLSKGRFLDSDIDELVISKKALSEIELNTLLLQQDPNYKARINNWYEKELKKAYDPLRNSEGKIRESRVIFDEGSDWTQKDKAETIIRRIKKAGFNVYVPCVWHGKGVRYKSDLALRDDRRMTDSPGSDSLSTLIEIAHENGIEVHPWFCVALRQRSFYEEFYSTVHTPKGAFDIHRPEFREFITSLIIDVVRRYDVDGINLDYIRTMGFCKCDYCVDEYKRVYGRNLFSDVSLKNKDGRLEPHLQKWQDEAVEAVVRRVSVEGKKIRPGLIISVDGHPLPKIYPPSWQGRRTIVWANKGLVDVIYNMDYAKRPDFEKHGLVASELNDPSQLIMLLGNYKEVAGNVTSINAEDLGNLVGYLQRKWRECGGVGVYLYSMLNDEQVEMLSGKWFNEEAVPRWDNKQVPAATKLHITLAGHPYLIEK